MSAFLGIPYNKWHGVIPAIMSPILMGIAVLKFGATQLVFMATVLCLTIFLLMLQGVNESWQSLGNIERYYGSWKNFQSNSRDDWKWFLIGWIVGLLLSVIVFTVIDKVFL